MPVVTEHFLDQSGKQEQLTDQGKSISQNTAPPWPDNVYFVGPYPDLCESLAEQIQRRLAGYGLMEGFEMSVCRDIVAQIFGWDDFDELTVEGCVHMVFPIEVLSKAEKRIRFGHGLETLFMWDVPVRTAFDTLTGLSRAAYLWAGAKAISRD